MIAEPLEFRASLNALIVSRIETAVFEWTSVSDHELGCASGALGRIDRPSFGSE